MRRLCAIMLLLALTLAPAACAGGSTPAPSASPAPSSSSAPIASPPPSSGTDAGLYEAAPPTPEEYVERFCDLIGERGLSAAGEGGELYISDCVQISVQSSGGAISRIDVSARGDGSALSGEIIAKSLACAVMAYSPIDESALRARLIDLMSLTQGRDSLPGLDVELALSPAGLTLALTPSSEAPPAPSAAPTAAQPAGSIGELIRRCAALLPEGWTQTSYISGDAPDALINVYAAAPSSDALWDCAQLIMREYFIQARDASLDCGRLSMVFYSPDMTPLLSLGISRADALASAVITSPSAEPGEFRAEMERLAGESDALLVEHYAAQ